MSDRRTEAFAALDEWETFVEPFAITSWEQRLITALRSVLERHRPDEFDVEFCRGCHYHYKGDGGCPDETAVIDAVLGVPDE